VTIRTATVTEGNTRMPQREPVDIWKLGDLCTPWCVHVVVTLRVADHIAAGTSEILELAVASGADADALCRVLRHLVSEGVFEEPALGRFALNEPARALVGPGARLGFDLDGFGGRMAHAWGSLLTAVRTGAPAYHTVFGRPFWDDLQAHPELAASFDALMGPAGHGVPDPEVLIAGDWNDVRTVVDVGGGTGALLADWPDREAQALLHRCAEAARPAGRVVLLGGVSPDEDGPASPALLMMVLVGGKERTLRELRELARPAGLDVHAAARQPSGRFIVECRPR
jgi:2,7-dihydroxy-5-methyl-1-naphthoate 7-O-methyltransferase